MRPGPGANDGAVARRVAARWKPRALLEELKGKARAAGLWTLFLPESESGAGLTNLEYAPLTEPDVASSDTTNIAPRIRRNGDDDLITGRKGWTSSAHDTARLMK